jgi:hypothetical protein
VYARVAKFEGGDPEQMDRIIESVREQAPSGPPEGVPAVEFLMLADRQGGRSLGITFFESEEDMRKGDEALNAMSPPMPDISGRRTSVEMYEVAVRASA